MKSISLVGMPASGKSAIGKALASQLKRHFFDVDTEIERLEQRAVGKLYDERGEHYLTALETELVSRYLIPEEEIILGLSSSTLNDESMRIIKTLSLVVWVKPTIEILAMRLKAKGGSRPFHFEHSVEQSLSDLQKQRNHLYEEADIILDVVDPKQSASENAKIIISEISSFRESFFSL